MLQQRHKVYTDQQVKHVWTILFKYEDVHHEGS